VLEEQLLDAQKHDRKSFKSGVPELDDYLHRYAAQQGKKGVSVVRVLIDTDSPSTILGYYSLSAAQIDAKQLPEDERKKLPRYPVPCFRLGRLAVDLSTRRKGTGKILVALAVERCLLACQNVAAYALLVDAKNENAIGFYKHYGFIPCVDDRKVLYLPLMSQKVIDSADAHRPTNLEVACI